MTWWGNRLHEYKWISVRSVDAVVLLVTRRIDLGVTILLKGGVWDGTHVLILVQVKNWPLCMPPSLPLFPNSREKEWCLYSEGIGQIPFRILSLLWKLEWLKPDEKLMTKILTSWWTRSCGRSRSYPVNLTCQKNLGCKLTLQMLLEFEYGMVWFSSIN